MSLKIKPRENQRERERELLKKLMKKGVVGEHTGWWRLITFEQELMAV